MSNNREAEFDGNEVCWCKHHRLYHTSDGRCFIENCKCGNDWEPKMEDNEKDDTPSDPATLHAALEKVGRTMGSKSTREWHLLGCANGGAVLVRGTDVREHPQSHLQILPLEEARLMMASQDLLAAAKQALAVLDADGIIYGDSVHEPLDVINALQVAIAKAEGR